MNSYWIDIVKKPAAMFRAQLTWLKTKVSTSQTREAKEAGFFEWKISSRSSHLRKYATRL